MAEDRPSLHIDTDWKKQAQEEKKRLAEQEAKRAQQQASAPPAGGGMMGGAGMIGGAGMADMGGAAMGGAAAAAVPGRSGRQRELPEASFSGLVQQTMTQVLLYLGDLAVRGGEPMLNLDMAKHHLDTLTILEEKTKGNLSAEEQRSLDAALYETRMRFVSVAQQFLGP